MVQILSNYKIWLYDK